MLKTPRRYLIITTIACVSVATFALLFYLNTKPKADLLSEGTAANATCLDSSYKDSLMASWYGTVPDGRDTPGGTKKFVQDDLIKKLSNPDGVDTQVTLYNLYASLSQVVTMETECHRSNSDYDKNDLALISDISEILLLVAPNTDGNGTSLFSPTKDDADHYVWRCTLPKTIYPSSVCIVDSNKNDVKDERLLYSAQFVDFASMLAHAIAQVPANSRTANMTTYANAMGPVLIDHYNKWLSTCTKTTTTDCPQNSDLTAGLTARIAQDPNFISYLYENLGTDTTTTIANLNTENPHSIVKVKQPVDQTRRDEILAHFNDLNPQGDVNIAAKKDAASSLWQIVSSYAIDDKQMLIADGAINMLAANKADTSLFPLDDSSKKQLATIVQAEANLMQIRSFKTNLKDFAGAAVNGLDFERGVWYYFSQQQYEGLTDTSFSTTDIPYNRGIDPATAPDGVDPGGSWDVAHSSSRWSYFLSTMYEYKDLFFNDVISTSNTPGIVTSDSAFPSVDDMNRLANQVSYALPIRADKSNPSDPASPILSKDNFDFSKPLFGNYINGSQGWFALYINEVCSTTTPSTCSITTSGSKPQSLSAYMLHGWGQLATFGKRSITKELYPSIQTAPGLKNVASFDSLTDLQILKLAGMSVIKLSQNDPSNTANYQFCDKYISSACNSKLGNAIQTKVYANLLYLPAIEINAAPGPTNTAVSTITPSNPTSAPTSTVTPLPTDTSIPELGGLGSGESGTEPDSGTTSSSSATGSTGSVGSTGQSAGSGQGNLPDTGVNLEWPLVSSSLAMVLVALGKLRRKTS